jgi:hypothetical protein
MNFLDPLFKLIMIKIIYALAIGVGVTMALKAYDSFNYWCYPEEMDDAASASTAGRFLRGAGVAGFLLIKLYINFGGKAWSL